MTKFENHKDCLWANERIDPYLDGDLAKAERSVLETHVASCNACAQALQLSRQVLSELHSMPAQRCPDHVVESVFDSVEASAPQPKSRRSWFATPSSWLQPALAATFVVLVAVSVFVMTNRPADEHFTAEDVADATDALKWTFAYVGEINQRSAEIVRDEVFADGLVTPVNRAVRSSLNSDTTRKQTPAGGS